MALFLRARPEGTAFVLGRNDAIARCPVSLFFGISEWTDFNPAARSGLLLAVVRYLVLPVGSLVAQRARQGNQMAWTGLNPRGEGYRGSGLDAIKAFSVCTEYAYAPMLRRLIGTQ